ncbi:MAG: metal-dependent hydrolase [Acidimicrobiales bacterium]|nr:metal-dependent hydrolase [Acidimicrobiales bacterium]
MAPTTTLPERRVRFAYPDDLDPCWCHRFPEFACAANSISLIMPFAEPYFVKTVRSTLPELDEPLRSQTEAFCRQELAHHVEHRKFNALITRRYPEVVRVEGWMRRAYGWLSRTRSRRFNLAFAAGSEAIAYALARWIEAHLAQLFSDADPVPSTLFLWHLAEEVEHKSAAHDVFEALDGSRLRYAWATSVSVALLAFFVWTASLAQLKAQGRFWNPIAHLRMARWGVSVAFTMLPTLAVSALPGHTPRRFTDPIYLPKWLALFDPATGTIPVPTVIGSPVSDGADHGTAA